MEMKSKVGILLVCLSLSLLAVFVTVGAAADAPASAQTIERLERLILEQRNQLKSLQEQVNELKKTTADAQTQAQKAESVATEAKTMVQPPSGMAVTSGGKQVKLAISGQVHRAMNVADDGKSTHAYFVDPDSSNTRVRFIGTAAVDEDLTIGTKIEVAIAPNESSQVSQQDEESGDFFDQRWAEISLASRRFGKLSFGKGDTASNNSQELGKQGIKQMIPCLVKLLGRKECRK